MIIQIIQETITEIEAILLEIEEKKNLLTERKNTLFSNPHVSVFFPKHPPELRQDVLEKIKALNCEIFVDFEDNEFYIIFKKDEDLTRFRQSYVEHSWL